MRERKQYPDLSDEELDRRAEEALKRMLDKPQGAQAPHQNNSQKPHSKHRRKRRR